MTSKKSLYMRFQHRMKKRKASEFLVDHLLFIEEMVSVHGQINGYKDPPYEDRRRAAEQWIRNRMRRYGKNNPLRLDKL